MRESFDKPGPAGGLPDGWRAASGEWRARDGALLVDSLGGEALVVYDAEEQGDCDIEVSASFIEAREPSRWLAVVFRAGPGGSPPRSQFAVRQGTARANGLEFAVRTAAGTWDVRAKASAREDSAPGRHLKLGVRLRRNRVALFMGGEEMIRSEFCVERAAGRVGFAASGVRARFDLIAVTPAPADARPRPARPPGLPCLRIAHRGFSAVAPENTLVGLAMGVAAGADACEFDVRATADGVPVLMHDEKVDRTTDGRGRVADMGLEELRRLDAGSARSPAFAGERVPTLKEALARLGELGAAAAIEVKEPGVAAAVARGILESRAGAAATVIAFDPEALQTVRAIAPDVPRGLLVGGNPEGEPRARAAGLAAKAAACGAGLVSVDYRMLSPEVVAELHGRGVGVWAWTVNEPAVMSALFDWGVDGITTDNPLALAREIGAPDPRGRAAGRPAR